MKLEKVDPDGEGNDLIQYRCSECGRTEICVSFDDPEQVYERQRDTGSCGSLVLLVRSPRDDLQGVIRQRPLQRLRLVPRRAHPDVALFVRRQDHRHRLWVDWFDDCVRRGREKTIDIMRPRHRLRLRAAITVERRPDASEGEQRAIIVEREPDHVLFLRLRVRLRRVLGEAVDRDQAAVFRF